MKIKTLENIIKKDSFLYYRNEYNAVAVFAYGKDNKQEKARVEFSVEKTAIGDTKINAAITDHINYPMLAAIKELKEYVQNMQNKGNLP